MGWENLNIQDLQTQVQPTLTYCNWCLLTACNVYSAWCHGLNPKPLRTQSITSFLQSELMPLESYNHSAQGLHDKMWEIHAHIDHITSYIYQCPNLLVYIPHLLGVNGILYVLIKQLVYKCMCNTCLSKSLSFWPKAFPALNCSAVAHESLAQTCLQPVQDSSAFPKKLAIHFLERILLGDCEGFS